MMNLQTTPIPNSLTAKIATGKLEKALNRLKRFRDRHAPRDKLLHRVERAIRSLTREFRRIEAFNTRLRLKCAMLQDPLWRERVIADLGGELELFNWENRQAIALQTILKPRLRLQTDITEQTEAKPRVGRKMDREGLFYLAPVKMTIREITKEEREAIEKAKAFRLENLGNRPIRQARHRSVITPIPVVPSDFDGDKSHDETPSATLRDQDVLALQNGFSPHDLNTLFMLIRAMEQEEQDIYEQPVLDPD